MNHTMKKILITLAACIAALTACGQAIWDSGHLARVKASITQPYYAASFERLKQQADSLLDVEPLSVMMKPAAPLSGDMHDYMSLSRYYWPNPSKPDGLPYVYRDGESTPEFALYDRNRLGMTAERVQTLALAWYLSGDERYAAKAARLLRTWFLDRDTRMNPHLEYSQVARGHNGNKGNFAGLIDTYSFVEMLDAVALLNDSRSWTKKDDRALRKWFGALADWMTTSPNGRKDDKATNNHSVAYDAQIIAFSLYAGRRDKAIEVIEAMPGRRLAAQVDDNGAQPRELTRTRAFHYSHYNLSHFLDILSMARNLGLSPDSKLYYAAADYLMPYIGRNPQPWPYKEITGMALPSQELAKTLYRTAQYLIDPADTLLADRRAAYMRAWRDTRIYDPADPFNLLYVEAGTADNGYAFATMQLPYAVTVAAEEARKEQNALRARLMPRSIAKDSTLAMIDAYDWCSGFFPGSLWQLYDYTNNPEHRQLAVSWTWRIEDAKNYTGNHDIGFMVNNSFGRALDATGERSYRDVLLRATESQCTRYNPDMKLIRSWDFNCDIWQYPVIIDNMMNLEMLFHATQLTGDSTYYRIAVNHADKTMSNHFRPDASSYHVVDYDTSTGEARLHVTHQGYDDDSFWSRGQGWGLYGYTMCYRFTADSRYLRLAERIADFILGMKNMPSDGVPYWDMHMPAVDNLTPDKADPAIPRDASAAAIIASALYELAGYTDSNRAAGYLAAADRITDSLTDGYRATMGGDYGFLLLHSTGHHPAGSEIDVPLNYADYYYLEALGRRRAINR